MECPDCKSKTIVIDSKDRPGSKVFRIRECMKCRIRFSTKETVTGIERKEADGNA